jgi:redox-sensitive bicupin YhaK (pirin superfamily)
MADVELVIEGRARDVGTLPVARVLPSPKRRLVGPFIFLDHMGPTVIAPGVGFDVLPHPHIGLSTVSYFLEGENLHRDSIGTVQVIHPGDVNLMTAGRGVVHSERAEPEWRRRGGTLHGLQLWLALPTERELDEPSFEHHPQATLPAIEPAVGVRGRVLMGTAFGARSPIRHPSEPLLVDLAADAGSHLTLDGDDAAPERGLFVAAGEVELDGQVLGANHLAVLSGGRAVGVRARAPSRIFLLGGPHLGERHIDWNFVASTRDLTARARDAWKARAFPSIPGDDVEFVPYPELFR